MADENQSESKPAAEKAGFSLTQGPVAIGLAAVVIVGSIGAAIIFGKHHAGTGGGMGSSGGRDLSARSLCEATLDTARDFGVLTPDATLASSDAQSGDTKDRFICQAKIGAVTVTMAVDQLCTDMGNPKCLAIWNISDSTGQTLYQQRDFLPPDDQ